MLYKDDETSDLPTRPAQPTVRPEMPTVKVSRPARLGEFRIEREIGRGGMGVVYLAVQESLGRQVAVKVLPLAAASSPTAAERFLREASLVAKLQHKNIVQVYDMGQDQDCLYYAMEYVEGDSLRDRIGKDGIPAREAARIVLDVARALHHAHQSGVVHRDVKPANILLDRAGTPRLADFGLARGGGSESLTMSGDILGTPAYMSPEQAGGERGIDARTDVYSLGAVLYDALTGSPPVDPQLDLVAQINAVLTLDPPPPSRRNPRVPRDLDVIVGKCLQKDRGRRYASAAELADDLERYLSGEAIRARPPSLAERLKRVVRRNRVAAVAFAIFVVASSIALAWQATRPGWLTLQVAPRDALVRIDGRGAVPAGEVDRLRLSAGPHSLRIEREGYEPLVMPYTARRAEAATVPVNLRRLQQRLTVVTDPPDAILTIRGREGKAVRRLAPVDAEEVDTGAYEVVAETEGRTRARARLELGTTDPVSVRLTLLPGVLWKAKQSQLAWLVTTRLGTGAEPVLAACSTGGEVDVFRGRDGKSLATARATGPFAEPSVVRLEGDAGPSLLVADQSGGAELLRLEDGRPRWTQGPPLAGKTASFVPVFSAAEGRPPELWLRRDAGIEVIDLRTGQSASSLAVGSSILLLPLDDAHGGFVVQRSDSIASYDASGKELSRLPTPQYGLCGGVAMDLDGKGARTVILTYSDGSIRAWRANPLEPLWETPPGPPGMFAVGVLRPGERPSIVAVVSTDRLRVWDSSGRERWVRRLPAAPATPPILADMEADGRRQLVYASLDTLWVLDLQEDRTLLEAPIPHASLTGQHPPRPRLAVADLDDDGLLDVAVSAGDGTIQVVPGRRVLWSYAAEHSVRRSPALLDAGKRGAPEVVFTSLDAHAYALDGDSGRRLWSVPTEGQAATTPAVVGGDAVVASWGGPVMRIEGRTGRVVWSYRPTAQGWADNIHASLTAAEVEGRAEVFVADWRDDLGKTRDSTGAVHCLDAATGEVRWVKELEAPFATAPVLLGPGELVVADIGGNLYCLDPRDGTVRWKETYRGQFRADARWSPGEGRALYWTVLETGEVLELRPGQRGARVAEQLGRALFLGWAREEGRTLTVLCARNEVRAVDAGSKEPVWKRQVAGTILSAPLCADLDGDGRDEVVVADETGEVVCLDGATGERRWSWAAGAGIEASPIAADMDGDGRPEVIVATLDGRVVVLSGLGHRWSCDWTTPWGDQAWTNAPASVGPDR